MTWTKVPLATKLIKHNDSTVPTPSLNILRNGYVDGVGAIRQFPGLTVFRDTGNTLPIRALYFWKKTNVVIAVIGTSVYLLSEGGGQTLLGGSLSGLSKPSFAEDATTLFIADGSRVFSVIGNTLIPITGTNAPTLASSIVFFDTFLIALEETQLTISNVGDPTNFSVGNFISANAFEDEKLLLFTNKRDIIVLSSRSIEFFFNDGVAPFAPNKNRFINVGALSRDTFTAITDDLFVWLSDENRIVSLDTNKIITLSNDIQVDLDNLTNPKNSFGFTTQIRGQRFYIITFLTDNKTFAYNFSQQSWNELSKFNPNSGSDDAYIGKESLDIPQWSRTLLGDRSDGIVYDLDEKVFTENGASIRTVIQTKPLDYGSMIRKHVTKTKIVAKLGAANATDASTTEPQLLFRYSLDGKPVSKWREISFKKVGNQQVVANIYKPRSFYTIKYQFNFAEEIEFIFAALWDDVVLGST